jgi:hypothetical protein
VTPQPDWIKQLVELSTDELTNEQISKVIGKSKTQVNRWRIRLDLPRPGSGRRKGKTKKKGSIVCRDYSQEQADFLRAIDDWRRVNHAIPSLVDGFRILLSMGYKRESI